MRDENVKRQLWCGQPHALQLVSRNTGKRAQESPYDSSRVLSLQVGHEEGCSQKQGTCDAGSPQQHAAGNAQFEPVHTEGTAPGPTSTHDSCGRPEGSAAADRSLLGANYQKQGPSRKRKHGNPPAESCPASADPPLPGDRPEAQPDAAL